MKSSPLSSLTIAAAATFLFCFLLWAPVPAGAAVVDYRLTIAEQDLNITGEPARGMTVNGGIPGPTLRFKEGDTAVIHVRNATKADASIHWHGVLVPNAMDGVPYVTFPPIKPGTTFTYTFPIRQAGTYWYHSHSDLQEQLGVYGPIVIEPVEQRKVADADYVVLFSDWSDEDPHSIHRTLKRGSEWYGIEKGSSQSLLGAVRAGRVKDFFKRELERMPPMDIADVAYNRFLANGSPETALPAKPGETVRLRVIAGASMTFFYLNFAGGPMTIIAADGQDVVPVDVNVLLIGAAETYDLLVKLPPDGAQEFRATAQDGSGYASVWLGSGSRHAASSPPRADLYATMDALGWKRVFALTPAGSMGMPDRDVQAGKFDQPGMMGSGSMKMDSMDMSSMKMGPQDMGSMHQGKAEDAGGMQMGSMESMEQPDERAHPMRGQPRGKKGGAPETSSPAHASGHGMHAMEPEPGMEESAPSGHAPQAMKMNGTEPAGEPSWESAGTRANAAAPINPDQNGKRFKNDFRPLASDVSSSKALAVDGMDPRRPWPPYGLLRATRSTAFPKDKPVREIRLTLDGDMQRYVWFLDNKPLSEKDDILVRQGEIVRFIMINRTMMHHPMHLHGHFFRVVNGQGDYAPLKHTVDVAPMSTTVIEFDAGEAGDWFFHCHLLYHMMSGMARVVHYEGFTPQPPLSVELRSKLYRDDWYFWGDVDAMSNMGQGSFTLSNTRHILNADWEAGWQNVSAPEWELALTWGYYLNRFATLFTGADLEGVENDLDTHNGVFGVRYLLPLNLESLAWVDTGGELRFAIGKTLPLTPRLTAFGDTRYDTGTHWESRAGLSYLLDKNLSLVGQWHSKYGFGGGITMRF